MDDLTDKQRRFVQEYLVDHNGTQAAIRAGYAAGQSAEVQASRLLNNDKIKSYVKSLSQTIADKLGIDVAYVLGGIKKIADTTTEGENFNPNAANKSYELLGKHLRLFEDDDKKQTTVNIQIVQF